MSDRVRTGTLSLFLLAVLVAAGGCGNSSFVGHHYDNFTAYYNTFYNAGRAFDDGVKALERSDDAIDRRYYIDVFTAPDRASNSDRFQNAIDKSADVLRDHPDSKWVDDALLLIGQSYFYQLNFVGAEQKFREVISLGSVVEDEARLWLARTLVAAGSFDEARDHLVASLAQEDLSKRWAPRIHLALGELYVKQENFEAAAEELEAGLEDVRDNELEARAWLLLGQVLETLGRYEDSVAAYERVADAHPPYELSYAANISAVRVKGLHIDSDEALRELRRMQRDDKNFSNRLELAYLNGLIYQAQGRPEDARSQYYEILYDSDGQLADLRGRIHYALGELFRTVNEDYVLASAHYDTARTSLSSRATDARNQEQYTPEAVTDADQKAEMFATFATVRSEIARMDSLMMLGSLDPDEFADRILEIRKQKARELTEQQRLVAQRQAERGFQDAAARAGGGTGRTDLNDPTGEAGFLFHRDPVRIQESRMNFITLWGDRPLVPNWRRSEAIASVSSSGETAEDAVTARLRDGDPGVGQNPLPELDYSDVPLDSLRRAGMRAERALARYELGNVLFLAMNRADSAAAWYRMVIEEDAGESVAQRAYYALAEVQRSLGDTAAARSIYEQVLRDYPDSDFAGRVREQLGIQGDVPSDSLTMAAEEYDRAFEQWRRGAHRQALNEMVSVAAQHRHTEVAPKALLAAGRIFLEWAEQDSLNIFGPLPLALEDSVIGEAGLRGSAVPTHQDPGAGSAAGVVEPETAAETPAAGDDSPSPRRRVSDADSTSGEGDEASVLVRRDIPGSSPGTNDSSSEEMSSDEGAASADSLVARAIEMGSVSDSADADGEGGHTEPLIAAGVTPDDVANPAIAAADSLAATSAPLLASAEEDDIYLQTLYASISSRYPSSVYASQAEEMLSALETYQAERQAEEAAAVALADSAATAGADSLAGEPADSLAAEPADSLVAEASDSLATPADSLASEAADSLVAVAVPDSMNADSLTRNGSDDALPPAGAGAGAEKEASSIIPAGEASIRGDGGIVEALGGYTLVLGMNVVREPMEALAARYSDQGFRTDVIAEKVGGTTVYRAALGHFATMDMARRALQTYRSTLESGVQVAPLTLGSTPQ